MKSLIVSFESGTIANAVCGYLRSYREPSGTVGREDFIVEAEGNHFNIYVTKVVNSHLRDMLLYIAEAYKQGLEDTVNAFLRYELTDSDLVDLEVKFRKT